MSCEGTESRLVDCNTTFVDDVTSVTTASHRLDVGVACISDNCTEGDLRLQGGSDSSRGRVEVCHRGLWGTVCNISWSNEDAVVACRQMGLPSSSELCI